MTNSSTFYGQLLVKEQFALVVIEANFIKIILIGVGPSIGYLIVVLSKYVITLL